MSERKSLRKVIERASQINQQIQVLEQLSKKRMTSQELRDFVEGIGGNYDFILPILKNAGLIIAERHSREIIYSLQKNFLPLSNNPKSKSTMNIFVRYANENSSMRPVTFLYCQICFPVFEPVNS